MSVPPEGAEGRSVGVDFSGGGFPPLKQMGLVLEDAEKSAGFMESVLGWGPFSFVEVEMNDYRFRGERGNCVVKIALGQSGPVEIELIEVLRGDEANPYSAFLRDHGEGVQHVRLDSPANGEGSLEDQLAEFAKHGVEPHFEVSLIWGEFEVDVAYLDARQMCGLIVEVSGPPRMHRDSTAAG
ncbi:MAG: hypothetical protein CL933_15690 [Deltaproteobacteria bacterium]|nr:hypothetical protein [Deltaproteobacteria bacterium]